MPHDLRSVCVVRAWAAALVACALHCGQTSVAQDPHQKHNLAATNKKVFNELAAALRAHVQRGGATPWQQPLHSKSP